MSPNHFPFDGCIIRRNNYEFTIELQHHADKNLFLREAPHTNVEPVFALWCYIYVGNIADVSEILPASIFREKRLRMAPAI
jgi:hypothetical protein